MKILAPIAKPEEAEDLIKAGADELYCGLFTDDWARAYTNIGSPNRRYWRRANLSDWSQLKEILNIAYGYNVKVSLTLNENYSEEQYPLVIEQVEKAVSLGIDGLIIADISLLDLLKNRGFNISVQISTVNTVFNSESVRFFKSFGTNRITLPRHLSLNEIEEIVKGNTDINFDVFIMNDACRYTDGFCTFLHGVEEFENPKMEDLVFRSAACYLNYDVTASQSIDIRKIDQADVEKKIKRSFTLYNGVKSCAACNLGEFREWGINGLKIAGRHHPRTSRTKDVLFIKTLLAYLNEKRCCKEELHRYARELFKKIYLLRCDGFCYYEN